MFYLKRDHESQVCFLIRKGTEPVQNLSETTEKKEVI